jgi:uncharacterized protein
MTLIIDGHNLIPHVRGLSLTDLDDELHLVQLLAVYCRMRRVKLEVYFDQAAVGHAGKRPTGQVMVHFVRQGLTADQAIIERLRKMGKGARQVRLVTSDRRVQSEARALGAEVVPSEQFAAELEQAGQAAAQQVKEQPPQPSQGEIDEWLDLFGSKK